MSNIPKNAFISVAGTVGAGKSTLTRSLAKKLNFEASFEKVDGNPYLDKYYRDFKRWSFHLQIYFLSERFKDLKRISDNAVGIVQDRSIYEDRAIFAKRLYDTGDMSREDYKTYSELFDAMVMTPYVKHPDVLIYLKTDINDAVKRVNIRGREMEMNTPAAYWEDLIERYEQWINDFHVCPVITVNTNEYDLIHDPSSISVITNKLEDFFADKT